MRLNAYIIGIGTCIMYSHVSIRGSLFFLTKKSLHLHAHIPYNIKFVYHAHDYNIMTCYRHDSNALRLDIPIHSRSNIVLVSCKVLEYLLHKDRLLSKDHLVKKNWHTIISIRNFVVGMMMILEPFNIQNMYVFVFTRHIIPFVIQ